MCTLAIWSRVVQSRDVSPHNFDGLAMSVLAISVAPAGPLIFKLYNCQRSYYTELTMFTISFVLDVTFASSDPRAKYYNMNNLIATTALS